MTGDRVDHIVFTWSDRLLVGGSGLGPVASSLGPDALRVWNQRLAGGDIAVGQWFHGAPECVALGALTFGQTGGEGAVLRVLPARDPNGRISQVVHALVGAADTVDARLALGLHDWTGWITADAAGRTPPTLRPEHGRDLRKLADAGLDALPVRPDALRGLLAGVLAAPADAYAAEIAPDDYGLVAALVTRLDGTAGDLPWTVMLGADVTRAAVRPRVLALASPEARRGRTLLTTAPPADSRFARAAGLLSDLGAVALTRPAAPLSDPELLLDWVEAEHQRASTVLTLVDRALDGTLDEPGRRHLNGPAGQERLRAETRLVPVAVLADRLARWAAHPPHGLEEAARTLRRVGALRYLADAEQDREAAKRLLTAAGAMGVAGREAADILAEWRAGQAGVTPTHEYGAIFFALRFGLDLAGDPTIGGLLPGMTAVRLLRWSAELAAADDTRAARHFLATAHAGAARSRRRRGDADVRELLRETEAFHDTIARIVQVEDLSGDAETALYRQVFELGYGVPEQELRTVLADLPADGTRTEFRPWLALADLLGGGTEVVDVACHAAARGARSAVLQAMLEPLPTPGLLQAARQRPDEMTLVTAVLWVVGAREATPEERTANRRVLLAARFLIDPVERTWPTAADRCAAYGILLGVAYRVADGDGRATGLTAAEAKELLALDGPEPFLFALLQAAGEDAVVPVLLALARRSGTELGLPAPTVDAALRTPHHRTVEIRTERGPAPQAPRWAKEEPPKAPLPPAPFRTETQGAGHSAGQGNGSGGSQDKPAEPEGRGAGFAAWLGAQDRRLLLGGGAVVLVLLVLVLLLAFTGGSGEKPKPGPTVYVTKTVSPSPSDDVKPDKQKRQQNENNDGNGP
ncbi:hypothetical protein BTM25_22280 [Actinomadura rubteroloni]|uniref:Uncharacterized protein n=1 Tax=Actinomadura rubteroloni TaxID=1926885 RepID=A0A2P4URZ0_9ACTN|nr:hypothetical protein [Actinomadura rubteroloni]POM27806.1 hypothetical protein BTM25_22280 [Actinomadura rubteroloni]